MVSVISPKAVIVVFAKAPVPGQAKTRLIPALGAEGAAIFHRSLVQRTLLTATAARAGDVEMWCAPTTDHPFFAQCATTYGVTLKVQSEGDIGRRMHAVAVDVLSRSKKMILIGTDCPALTKEDIQQTVRDLGAGFDAVFLPVEDGGYTLVGLSRPELSIFQGIDWSTERVMAQTRDRLQRLDWRWKELPLRWDLDRPQDLERLTSTRS